MGPLVIKVGGSLLDWPDLPDRLADYLAARACDRPILVVGGGRVADLVRDFDRLQRLGEARSHALALRALDLTAHLLAALIPTLAVVETLADALQPPSGRVPVLAPRLFLDEDDRRPDPLPHTWAVTTDSIAARVASRLGAAELALLKSNTAPPGTDRPAAARLGLVDPVFPEATRPLARVTYRNLRDPHGEPLVLLTRMN